MWRVAVVVVALLICLGSASSQQQQQPQQSYATNTTSAPETGPSESRYEPDLSDVQLDCRTDQMNIIGQHARLTAMSCHSSNGMKVTLSTFDLGTGYGYAVSEKYIDAMALACVCTARKCKPETLQRVSDDLDALDEYRREQERVVVNKVVTTLQSHSCIDAALSAKLAQLGFKCGASDAIGIRGESLRLKMRKIISAGLNGDADVDEVASSCWSNATTATSER